MRTLLLAAGCLLTLSAAASCSSEPAEPASGPELFANQCAMCHAADGAGGSLAPTLHGKTSHWTRATLIAYLKDPAGYAKKDPRLAAQGQKYSLPMTSFKTLPEWALERIADHVLAMP
jgi:cytochrome c2